MDPGNDTGGNAPPGILGWKGIACGVGLGATGLMPGCGIPGTPGY